MGIMKAFQSAEVQPANCSQGEESFTLVLMIRRLPGVVCFG